MRAASANSPATVRAKTAAPPASVAQDPEAQHLARPRFVWPVRVYYEDTDAGGLVYYANYLRFFERCRTEWMRALGFGQRDLDERYGVRFVVATAEIQYLRSAALDDDLVIDARIAGRHASYAVFEQQALRGSELLSRARVKVACVSARTMKPTRLPPALLAALEGIPLDPAPGDRARNDVPS